MQLTGARRQPSSEMLDGGGGALSREHRPTALGVADVQARKAAVGDVSAAEVTKRLVVAAIDEIILALATFQARVGRQVELVVDGEGEFDVMVSSEFDPPGEAWGFEQGAHFSDMESLWLYLQTGEL